MRETKTREKKKRKIGELNFQSFLEFFMTRISFQCSVTFHKDSHEIWKFLSVFFCYFCTDAVDAFIEKQTRFSHFPLMRRIKCFPHFFLLFHTTQTAVDSFNLKIQNSNLTTKWKVRKNIHRYLFAFCLSNERLLELKSNLVCEFFTYQMFWKTWLLYIRTMKWIPHSSWWVIFIVASELGRSSPMLSLSFWNFPEWVKYRKWGFVNSRNRIN